MSKWIISDMTFEEAFEECGEYISNNIVEAVCGCCEENGIKAESQESLIHRLDHELWKNVYNESNPDSFQIWCDVCVRMIDDINKDIEENND